LRCVFEVKDVMIIRDCAEDHRENSYAGLFTQNCGIDTSAAANKSEY
jgi:hypothetical protein